MPGHGDGGAERALTIGRGRDIGTELSVDRRAGHDETRAIREAGAWSGVIAVSGASGNRLRLLGLEACARPERGMELAFHRVELPQTGGSRQLP
jgi:hypothetical protein